MEELDEVDYEESEDGFEDLEVDVEDDDDVNPPPRPPEDVVEEEAASPIHSDREEGEATPRATESGAHSDLEDGEFVLDSEPMQLEEAASVDEAAAGRSSNANDDRSSEEERSRGRKQRRIEHSPETGPSPAAQYRHAHSPRARGKNAGQDRGQRTHGKRSRGQQGQGPSRQQSSQGFGDHFSDMQGIIRVGSLPASQGGAASFVDLSRRAPSPANGLLLSMRPSYAPPLEIRGSSNLMVHNLTLRQHLGFPPPAGLQQHLPLAVHLLPGPPAVRQPAPPERMQSARLDSFWPPNRPGFGPPPPIGGPPGGLLPGPVRPPLNPLGPGHQSPPENGSLFRHGSSPVMIPPGRTSHFSHPPESRNGHLHRGQSRSPGEGFAGTSYPPQSLLRGGSGKMESLRAQLESNGAVLGDPFRSRVEVQRNILATLPLPPPPPPPPPRRSRSDARRSHSRSPSERTEPDRGREQDVSQGPRQQRTLSAEVQVSGNAPGVGSRTGTVTGRGDVTRVVDRSPAASEARTSERDTSAERTSGERRRASPRRSVERSPRDGKSPVGSNSDKPVRSPGDGKNSQGDGREPEHASANNPGLSRAVSVAKSGSESQSEPVHVERSPSGARESEEKEKEARGQQTRARALAILEAGHTKKRKERDEKMRAAANDRPPGTSGREAFRPGVNGARREGRDKNGQRAPRNWRRHTDVDEEEQSEGSGDSPRQNDWSPEGFRREQVNGPGLFDRNGAGGSGRNGRQNGGGAWQDGGRNRGSDGRNGDPQPSGRRVVIGLGVMERGEDLERFPVRGRERAQSPGPPGFEISAPGQGSGFAFNFGFANRRARDEAAVLQRGGSGPVVSIRRKQPSRTLAVDNLPENFEESHLLDIFERYGPVQRFTQTGRSSAEITFLKENEAKTARAHIHRMFKLEGKEILVDYKTAVVM